MPKWGCDGALVRERGTARFCACLIRRRHCFWPPRREAVAVGYHGDWLGILRDPRWADVLSRRDGEQLKDKARNMKR